MVAASRARANRDGRSSGLGREALHQDPALAPARAHEACAFIERNRAFVVGAHLEVDAPQPEVAQRVVDDESRRLGRAAAARGVGLTDDEPAELGLTQRRVDRVEGDHADRAHRARRTRLLDDPGEVVVAATVSLPPGGVLRRPDRVGRPEPAADLVAIAPGACERQVGLRERPQSHERARRSHAQLGLARLSTEVEGLRRRRAVRLRERWRRPGDLSDAVAPAFRQMLDDSRLFAGDLRGFGLVPSESLRGSGPRTYPLRIERPGLSRITLAVAVDAAPTAGRLEIEILSPAGATLRRAAIDAALLSESEPVGFEFEPIAESPGVLRLRVGANGLDVPLRVFEWQRADLGGVARRARAFCGLGFVGRGDVVAAATNRVEDAQEGRGDDGREA